MRGVAQRASAWWWAPTAMLALMLALVPWPARAAFDEFSDDHSPKNFELGTEHMTLTLKGEVELELHDIEGEGGPGYDSPTDTQTIGTRSPFVEIDSLWLALRITLDYGLAVASVLEFSMDGANVGAVWLDYRDTAPEWLKHHVEVGYHTPFVKIDRRSERYPLIGTIYWRVPEVHLAYEATFLLARHTTLEVGASLGFMRPLAFAPVQESTSQKSTINVLSYGRAEPFSGNGPIGGGRVRFETWGAFTELFGFGGQLAAEGGTDVLRAGFSNWAQLDGYSSNAKANRDFFWFGGRVGYDGYGVHILGEAIASRESLFWRWGAYGQASYRLALRDLEEIFHAYELLARYEVYRIVGASEPGRSGVALRSPALINSVSWDYQVVTLALSTEIYRDMLRVRLEYYFIFEENGLPASGTADKRFRNDELLVQIELRF